ncbi:MAG TPA: hypothetical protein VKP11_05995, partial [Frankiaceae bacterium]|nr:hypothetical protein [Frankiaceae bacterium]
AGLVSRGFRVTPGLGIRVITPLGPLRLDAAYNDYPRQSGPLYRTVRAVGSTPGYLELVTENYGGLPRGRSFFGKLQFQFSVGEAY